MSIPAPDEFAQLLNLSSDGEVKGIVSDDFGSRFDLIAEHLHEVRCFVAFPVFSLSSGDIVHLC